MFGFQKNNSSKAPSNSVKNLSNFGKLDKIDLLDSTLKDLTVFENNVREYEDEQKTSKQYIPTPKINGIQRFFKENRNSSDMEAYFSTSTSSGSWSGYSSDSSVKLSSDPDLNSNIQSLNPTVENNTEFNQFSEDEERSKSKTHIKKHSKENSLDQCPISKLFSFISVKTKIKDFANSDDIQNINILSCEDSEIHNISKNSAKLEKSKHSNFDTSSLTNLKEFNKQKTRRRTKDSEGFIRRAACVCVNDDQTKVALISSKTKDGKWLIPGGGIEHGESEMEAAIREAWEEAGVIGNVTKRLGVFQLEDYETLKKKKTTVFVLQVEKEHFDFPEAEIGRVRKWFPIDSAIAQLAQDRPHQVEYLKAL